MELTQLDRELIADALMREAARLENSARDYRGVRYNTRNPAVRAMADEGMANAEIRIKQLRELAKKVDPRTTEVRPAPMPSPAR
jgi:hypothetical protein